MDPIPVGAGLVPAHDRRNRQHVPYGIRHKGNGRHKSLH
jgi:hypothetical protein